MGSVKSILSLKRIAENEAKRQPVVVVVSALGGVTDKLIEISQVALRGDEHWKDEFQALIDRHHRMIDAVITDTHDQEILFGKVDALLEQLRSIYFGVFLIHDLSKKTLDAIVSYGERISSNIVATLIRGAHRMNSRDFIRTEKKNGKHTLDAGLTYKLVREAFLESGGSSALPDGQRPMRSMITILKKSRSMIPQMGLRTSRRLWKNTSSLMKRLTNMFHRASSREHPKGQERISRSRKGATDSAHIASSPMREVLCEAET